MNIVRKAPGSELFAIGVSIPTKRAPGICFVPRDDKRYPSRAEAEAALRAEKEGRK